MDSLDWVTGGVVVTLCATVVGVDGETEVIDVDSETEVMDVDGETEVMDVDGETEVMDTVVLDVVIVDVENPGTATRI